MNELLTENYEHNIEKIESLLADCPDITRKEILLPFGKKGCFFYVQGLVDINLIQRDFINPILNLEAINYKKIKSS